MTQCARGSMRLAGIIVAGTLISACGGQGDSGEESVGTTSQALIETTWETLSSEALGSAAAVPTYGDQWLDAFYFVLDSGSPSGGLAHKYYDGTTWSTVPTLSGQQGMGLSVASSNDARMDVVWPHLALRPGTEARHEVVQSESWGAVETMAGISRPYGMAAVSTSDSSWFSVFYTDNADNTQNILKHQWFDKNNGSWSGEELLTDENGAQIADVDTDFNPAAVFDGSVIHVFYVRRADHKIKTRSYPYNGDWSKVSKENCTGQTVDGGGSFGVAWDGDYVSGLGGKGMAYLIFKRPGSYDIGVNYSQTFLQGSWYAHSSYTLKSGHGCVGGYSAAKFKPGKIEVFCTTGGRVTTHLKHGRFNSFG